MASITRIMQHMDNYDTGIITGYRSNDTYTQNKKRNKFIKIILKQKKYSFINVQAFWIYNINTPLQNIEKEHMFFVINHNHNSTLCNDLIDIGIKYNQDTILFIEKGGCAKLIGTNNTNNLLGFRKVLEFKNKIYGNSKNIFHVIIRNKSFYFL